MKLTDPEAETLLLSALMRCTPRVGALCVEANLTKDAFSEPANGDLYSYLLGVWGEAKPLERFIIVRDLRALGILETCGGVERIQNLINTTATESCSPIYVETIKDCAHRRRIWKATERAAADVQGSVPTSEVVGALRGCLDSANTDRIETPTAEQLTTEVETEGSSPATMPTGFYSIDHICGGVSRGDMLIVSGKSKAGKSALSANIARNIARKGFVACFTIEMSRTKFWRRMLCAEAGVEEGYFKTRAQSLFHNESAERSIKLMRTLPVTVIDKVTDIDQALAHCAMLKQKHGDIAGAVFDYLGLFSCEAPKSANMSTIVSLMSSKIKRAAKRLNMLAIVPCQLNDNNQALDSRAAERDCDLMLKIIRDEETHKSSVVVGYNRNGPMNCTLPLKPELRFNRFEETEEEHA